MTPDGFFMLCVTIVTLSFVGYLLFRIAMILVQREGCDPERAMVTRQDCYTCRHCRNCDPSCEECEPITMFKFSRWESRI